MLGVFSFGPDVVSTLGPTGDEGPHGGSLGPFVATVRQLFIYYFKLLKHIALHYKALETELCIYPAGKSVSLSVQFVILLFYGKVIKVDIVYLKNISQRYIRVN